MLLSISSLLNQARHTGSLIKSNDIIGALKPQASLPPVGKVAPGSSASEAAPCPSATTVSVVKEAQTYPLGYKEPLPTLLDSFWDAFVDDIPIAERETFVSTALELFVAYRSPGIPLHPSIDFLVSPYWQTRTMLQFLEGHDTLDYDAMNDSQKILCNQALWIVGCKASNLTNDQLSRIKSEFKVDDTEKTRFHEAFKVGSIVSSLWSAEIPLERMGNIKFDFYSRLNLLSPDSHTKLSEALCALINGW
ncbi:hypothetical protein L0F63_003897 [Massospora cicadina]|nr:hypothetical protein L0F63_003897 [Massospora cicadina]